MSRLRTNRVCFTLNNYELDDVDGILKWFDNDKKIKYGIVGQEVGESGTPHLQGFIHYDIDRKKAGIKFWKDTVPGGARAHFEAARGTDTENEGYCSKDGIYVATGQPQESTNKWATIFKTAQTDLEAALEIDPEIAIKHYHQIKSIFNDYNRDKMDASLEVLRDWQSVAMQKLQQQQERKVLFVVDEVGGNGKSVLAKHILTTMNAWACQGNLT